MKNSTLLIFGLFILSSCGTQPVSQNEREPASFHKNFTDKCSDLAAVFFKKDAYGTDKTFTRALIEKAIILSDGKILSKESIELRKKSHEALFMTFFPVNLPGTKQLSDALFEAFSRNQAMAQLHLALNDLSFLATRASYPADEAAEVIRADQKKITEFLNKTNIDSFAELSENQKLEFLNILRDSDVQSRRAMHFKVKSAYMSSIYDSPFGEKIAGIRLPLKIRADIAEYMKMNPLNLPQVKARKKYDVIVVGSGPAGSVIAHELQKKGKTVLLLESGSFVHPGAIDTKKFSEFKYSGQPNLFNHDSSIIFRAGSATGGGTAVNIDLAFSPELKEVRQQIERWRAEGFIAPDQFTEEEMKRAYSYVAAKVGTRTPALNEVNANNNVLLEGAKKTNSEARLYDLNSYTPKDAVGKISDKKSSVEAFLIPAMKDQNNPLHFRPNASVNKVLFEADGETAKGVSVKISRAHNVPGVIENPMGLDFTLEEDIEILADRIIVSAGSIGTPSLLMKSGLQNEMLGKHIVAHPSMPIIGKFNKPINILEGTASTVYVPKKGYILESTSASPGYAATMMPGTPKEVAKNLESFNQYAGFGVMLVDESSTSNKLVLDKNGAPVIHYDLTEKDKRTFVTGIADAARIMFAAGATEVLLPSTEFPVLKSLADVAALEKNLKLVKSKNVITSAHIQGTARMGSDPTKSVVDTNQMVWGTKNLYVADSAIHPMSVGANPMQTIYTLAKIFADKLD